MSAEYSSCKMLALSEIFFFVAISVLTVILLKALSVILLKAWSEKKKSRLPYPPSIPALPIVGSIPYMRNVDHLPKYFIKKAEELGPIFTFTIAGRRCLVLNSLETIEEALVRNATCFAGRPLFLSEANPAKGKNKGIAGIKYDAHYKKYQKLSLSILREFGFGNRRIMETRISAEVREIIDYIKTKNGEPFDPEEMSLQISANVGLSILLNKRDPYDQGLNRLCRLATEAMDSADPAVSLIPWLRFIPPFSRRWKKILKIGADLMEQLEQLVKSVKAGETDESFITRYLEKEGPNYDHEQLMFTLRDLIIGSTDPPANALRWTFLFLANNQSVQQRLQKIVDEAVPRDRLPSLEHKSKLPYLDATILEVMRIKTLGPLSAPHETLSDCELSGCFVPAGTIVFPNIYAAHMDPKKWPDPDVFRPERFLDEDKNIINGEMTIPFALGRRSCPGEELARQELFLIISGLVQNFTILPEEDNKLLDENEVIGIMYKAAHFKVRMIPRDK